MIILLIINSNICRMWGRTLSSSLMFNLFHLHLPHLFLFYLGLYFPSNFQWGGVVGTPLLMLWMLHYIFDQCVRFVKFRNKSSAFAFLLLQLLKHLSFALHASLHFLCTFHLDFCPLIIIWETSIGWDYIWYYILTLCRTFVSPILSICNQHEMVFKFYPLPLTQVVAHIYSPFFTKGNIGMAGSLENRMRDNFWVG